MAMKRTLYYVEQGSCYLEIVKVFYSNETHFKARVIWYTKPGQKCLGAEDLTIPKGAKENWQKIVV
jgi:hypothetical protein